MENEQPYEALLVFNQKGWITSTAGEDFYFKQCDDIYVLVTDEDEDTIDFLFDGEVYIGQPKAFFFDSELL